MDKLLSILTCCLPCIQLKAVSLYVIGSLGQRVYDPLDATGQVLLGELGSLVDSVDESHSDGGSQPHFPLVWCSRWGQC